jgi:phenylacetate-CoA ligase
MNWRKPAILALLRVSGSKIPQKYADILQMADVPEQLQEVQRQRLSLMVKHAVKNVEFYRQTLSPLDIFDQDGTLNIEAFHRIPFLGKSQMRDQFRQLSSVDHLTRGSYENSSGGSTGEPVRFLQDDDYHQGDVAATLFLFFQSGKDVGERELKLWGSERDIIAGSVGIREKLQNWLFNRKLVNSFTMSESDMGELVSTWNRFKPAIIWTYVDSILEFARFVSRNGLEVVAPRAIVTTAGTLHESAREIIEGALKTRVLNQYGSREVGVIGCETPGSDGLRLCEWKHYIEVVDDQGNQCPSGIEGEIVITCLENYSMPLIRFKIGDRGVLCDDGLVKRLAGVSGRVTDHFVLRDGSLVHGEYFTHLFYFRNWVKRFQVIQTEYDQVICRVVLHQDPVSEDLMDIEVKVKLVMGKNCVVRFDFVDEILPSKSGKYLYTRSELARR